MTPLEHVRSWDLPRLAYEYRNTTTTDRDLLALIYEELLRRDQLLKQPVAVCQCGEPINQDSCPKCGTWHDLHGRR